MNSAPRPLERPVEATMSWQGFCDSVIAQTPDAQTWHTYPVTVGKDGGENTTVALHRTKRIGLKITTKNPAPDGRVLVSWIDSLFDNIDVLTIAIDPRRMDQKAMHTAASLVQDWQSAWPDVEENEESCTESDVSEV